MAKIEGRTTSERNASLMFYRKLFVSKSLLTILKYKYPENN